MLDTSAQRFGLSESLIARINAVFAAYPQVQQARLYGSRARGNFKRGSDIDLAIVGDHLTDQHLLHIESDLDDLCLPYKIDLARLDRIDNGELRKQIDRVGKTFYQAPEARR